MDEKEITFKLTKKHMNWLRCLIPVATLWSLAIFHQAFDLSILRSWYAFPLMFTYLALFVGSLYIGLKDIIES